MTGVIKWLGSDKLSDLMDGVFGSLDNIFPNATTADYCDLISWVMSNGLPSDMGGLLEGKLPSDLVPWLSGVLNPKRNQSPTRTDKNYDYYLDYQFNKKWDGGAQITTGLTYEHIRTFSGETEEVHQSDNVAAYMQYDQRFWDCLSVSAGVRAEYYRIDKHYREAEKIRQELFILICNCRYFSVFHINKQQRITFYIFQCRSIRLIIIPIFCDYICIR